MSIPFNDNLSWNSYNSNPDWHQNQPVTPPPVSHTIQQKNQVIHQVGKQIFKQPFTRGWQFTRDAARLLLKVPIRSIWTPIVLPKNWKQRERTKINAKLAGYAFVQLASVPPKFVVALTALITLRFSLKKAQQLLDKSARVTAYLDGRASQLEALKEVGQVNASSREEYASYKAWLYTINPKLCRKEA